MSAARIQYVNIMATLIDMHCVIDVIAVVDAACETAFRALRCNGNDIIFNRSILVSFDVDFNSRHQMEALTWQEFSQSLKLPLRSQCEQGFSFILEFTTCVSMAIYITL